LLRGRPFGSNAFGLRGNSIPPAVDLVARKLLDLNFAKFGQDPGIKDIFCTLYCSGFLLSPDFSKVVGDRVLDGVRSFANSAGGNESLSLAPLPSGFLRLPESNTLTLSASTVSSAVPIATLI
jgi:hypothetical protein